MLKRILLRLPLAASLASAGCQGLLQEEPKSFLTIDNFYQTAGDARSAVTSVYSILNAVSIYNWQGFMDLEGMSDNANAHPLEQNAPAQHPGQLAWDTQNEFMVGYWRDMYRLIYRADLALERIPDSPLPPGEKAAAIAEMKFLRGWAYLDLEKHYGGVPIFTSVAAQDATAPLRAPVAEVHAQAIQDLTEAEPGLPLARPVSEWGRATRGAARMALADLYLWRSSKYGTNEWQLASDWARKVIDSGQYRLLDDYITVFLPNNKANGEMIWVRTATGSENRSSSYHQSAFYPRELNPGGGSSTATATRFAYEQYQRGDYRQEVNFRVSACNLTNTQCFNPLPQGPHIYKFRPTNQTNADRGDTDHPIYRYAETLLIYAEAQNELGNTAEGIRSLNLVRARARRGTGAEGRLVPADYPSSLTRLQTRDAIFAERNLEMVGELKRWWDLVRRDGEEPDFFVSTLTKNDPVATQRGPVQTFRKLWPIPQREIDFGPSLTQNPGY